MWGLLKALVTQLHINMEPAAPSSSSTAMEPSPAQGNRCKDKAPTSLEDSKDDNKDMSKSILGGKSLFLKQGSGAPLYNIGLLNPRAELLSDSYEDILHVSVLCKQFKALHTALQLCIGLVEDGRMLVDIYSVIVTILYTMLLQLDEHDNIYIKRKYGKVCHFAILDDSNLVREHQTHLLDAITLVHANWSANRDLASWNYGKQSGKKKDASPAYPNKPFPKKKGTGAAPSAKFN